MSDLGVLDGLGQLGWTPISGGRRCVKFGGYDITAVEVIFFVGRPYVQFTGTYFSKRSMAYIEFKLPARVESLDQLKAFLAYYLDHASDTSDEQSDQPAWLAEGQALQELLPWEQRQAAYQARDHCWVERDWMRIGLKKLRALLDKIDSAGAVRFAFDGTVLRIEAAEESIVMQGDGEP